MSKAVLTASLECSTCPYHRSLLPFKINTTLNMYQQSSQYKHHSQYVPTVQSLQTPLYTNSPVSTNTTLNMYQQSSQYKHHSKYVPTVQSVQTLLSIIPTVRSVQTLLSSIPTVQSVQTPLYMYQQFSQYKHHTICTNCPVSLCGGFTVNPVGSC